MGCPSSIALPRYDALCQQTWRGLGERTVAETIWGSTNKPASSRRLARAIEEQQGLEGTLYIGYPILGTPEGAFPFDALFLSPQHGAIIFDIVEGRDPGNFEERQDNLYSKLQSKLLQYQGLVARRKLLPKITAVTYAPAGRAAEEAEVSDDYPLITDDDALVSLIKGLVWDDYAVFPALTAAIQSLTNIRKGRRKRVVQREDSRGAKIGRLNESIANLDADQSAATVDGVQRIRGLAGSGKTIVLALKVAYLHAQNPEWLIGVTFNTRSLKGQFERLINAFVIEQTSEEPDWTRIKILHSWGSPSS